MKEEEDNYRRKFVTYRNDPELKDHHLMLINVFDDEDLFHYSPNDEVEVKILICIYLTILSKIFQNYSK